MSRSVTVIIGLVILVGLVFFVASLGLYDGTAVSFRMPADDGEAVLSLRRGEPEPGLFTRTALEINEFFGEFGWYRDLSRAYVELGAPLKTLLNWIFGGFWAMIFLRRR